MGRSLRESGIKREELRRPGKKEWYLKWGELSRRDRTHLLHPQQIQPEQPGRPPSTSLPSRSRLQGILERSCRPQGLDKYALSDQAHHAHKDREACNVNFSDTRATLKGLRKYVKEVDAFLHSSFLILVEPQLLLALLVSVDEGPAITEGGALASAVMPTSRPGPSAEDTSSGMPPPTTLSSSPAPTTAFSTTLDRVRSGAIRDKISNPEQWRPGDVAILQNQEAKTVRHIGSLILDAPFQHDYEAGVEVRSFLPTERVEVRDGRSAMTDIGIDEDRYTSSFG